jgi:hypothetical protein
VHHHPSALYIAAMRYLWIGGIVALALLGAGCTSGSSSTATTHKTTRTTKPSAATTTLPAGSLKPGAKDTAACANYNSLKSDLASGKKPTGIEIRKIIKEFGAAEDQKLRKAGKAWAGDLVEKHKAKATKTADRINTICTEMGLN